ncbi:MAG: exodeoxyribonuclease VII large subunit [Hominimerdicola sp.]
MGSVLTVSQVNKYVAFKIKSDLKLKGVAVKGEISNFNRHYQSGHCYFTIKDSTSALKAVMFSGSFERLKFMPENGMNVLVTGNIEVYERDGVYQIIANDIAPLGAGIINTQIEQVKEKLKNQGVFDAENKKAIPLVPKKIAVVTSLTGAALQDILHITERRYPVCAVEIYPAQVQGAYAVQSICQSLEIADKSGSDTLILARGGGSVEDLMAFNSEEVVLAVAGCKTPIITAVGHETDTTLVDYASDMRAPTPSAAAELATPDKADILNAVDSMKRRLDNAIMLKISKQEKNVQALKDRLKLCSPQHKLDEDSARLGNYTSSMKRLMENRLKMLDLAVSGYVSSLNALSPFNVLNRGFSLVEKDGELVDSVKKTSSGDIVTVKFADGRAEAEIKSVCSDTEV